MANRVIQAKVLKMKRAVRKLPKAFDASTIHVGQMPLRELISEASRRATSGIPAEVRKRTTSPEEAEFTARMLFLEAMFPSMFGYKPNVPRSEVLKKLADGLGDVPLQQHICMFKTDWMKILLFFDAKKTKYIFVKMDFTTETVQVSINYGSRDRAFDVYRRKSILFKKRMVFDTAKAKLADKLKLPD